MKGDEKCPHCDGPIVPLDLIPGDGDIYMCQGKCYGAKRLFERAIVNGQSMTQVLDDGDGDTVGKEARPPRWAWYRALIRHGQPLVHRGGEDAGLQPCHPPRLTIGGMMLRPVTTYRQLKVRWMLGNWWIDAWVLGQEGDHE